MDREILPNSIANVLHPQGIARLLQQYPNRQFVEALISIATSGVRVGYEGPLSAQTRRPNHTSAFTHPDIITNAIQSEIQKGRIKELKNLPTNYYCSPIGLVPKLSEGKQKELVAYTDDMSSPNESHQNGVLNILIGRKCLLFSMHSFFGMSPGGAAWFV